MKKHLILAALSLALASVPYIAPAQDSSALFIAPEAVCIRQPINLISKVLDADSYYWGFCSGFLFYSPTGVNQGNVGGQLATPSAVEIAKDDTSYYGFIANAATNELLRLEYGNSLSNTPVVVNLGTLNNTVPDATNDIYITQDEQKRWVIFACGGGSVATSSIARFDFGSSLANSPNAVNFGNLNNAFASPRGIFVEQENSKWIGYVVNFIDNSLVRLDFGNNISLTPSAINLTDTFDLDNPTDLVPVLDTAGDWHLFVTNYNGGSNVSTLARIDLVDSLDNAAPVGTNLGNISGRLFGPTSITYARDCEFEHLFVTNGVSNDFVRIDFPDIAAGPYGATIFTGTGTLAIPAGISRIIRERDNLYSYIVNSGNNTLSQVKFGQCDDASITSSTSLVPPQYSYDDPGTYNVYFAINEGRPDMRVECQQIIALPIPQITFENDTTICQGDTVELFVQAFGSQGQQWYPNVSISDLDSFTVFVAPQFTTTYNVVLSYPSGCVVDTPVTITVNKVLADAGPDRTISDGAETQLGGPLTTEAGAYTYTWTPDQFISSVIGTNPVVSPPFDYTYYLTVQDLASGCIDRDTVVVRVRCDGIRLPNAFTPESSNPVTARFGLPNKQVVQLNYFRVFDRWGKEVFATTDVTKGWDGTVEGEPAMYGVYIWEVDGFCGEGQRFRETGNVTLIR